MQYNDVLGHSSEIYTVPPMNHLPDQVKIQSSLSMHNTLANENKAFQQATILPSSYGFSTTLTWIQMAVLQHTSCNTVDSLNQTL